MVFATPLIASAAAPIITIAGIASPNLSAVFKEMVLVIALINPFNRLPKFYILGLKSSSINLLTNLSIPITTIKLIEIIVSGNIAEVAINKPNIFSKVNTLTIVVTNPINTVRSANILFLASIFYSNNNATVIISNGPTIITIASPTTASATAPTNINGENTLVSTNNNINPPSIAVTLPNASHDI
jgi:hypothetical protein